MGEGLSRLSTATKISRVMEVDPSLTGKDELPLRYANGCLKENQRGNPLKKQTCLSLETSP